MSNPTPLDALDALAGSGIFNIPPATAAERAQWAEDDARYAARSGGGNVAKSDCMANPNG